MKVPAVVDHLIVPLRVAMVLAVIGALGYSAWFFFLGYGDDKESDPRSLQAWNMPTEVSAGDIIRANIFGELPAVEVEPEIVETNLNLKLVGISFNSKDPSKSRAYIIGRARQKPERLKVGERVAGIAELTDIFKDHVLLLRGGRKESLYIEQRERLIKTVKETSLAPQVPSNISASGTPSSLFATLDIDDDARGPISSHQHFELNLARKEEDTN